MPKNYYLILGVTSNASLEDIKAAFRRRARELHPDVSGLHSDPFLELQEAYAVLTDPERRRRYDQQRLGGARQRRGWERLAEPMVQPTAAAEPFRPMASARGFREVSLADTFETYLPSFDELFERWWSNFSPVERPKAERLESLTVEVVISPEEAVRGGRVRVWVPTRLPCPACGGSGAVGGYGCWHCEGHGALTDDWPVEVDYPAGLRDGYTVRLPLHSLGVQNFYLTLLFRVA
jgi:DnaJ-class molecular chaperone